MRFGFTGTQRGMTLEQGRVVLDLLKRFNASEFHHGDCIGADAQAHKIAVALKIPRIVIWPPNNSSKRAWCDARGVEGVEEIVKPADEYLLRNHKIAYFTEALIATPAGRQEELRSGTWATVRYARKYKRHIFIALPNGEVQEENAT